MILGLIRETVEHCFMLCVKEKIACVNCLKNKNKNAALISKAIIQKGTPYFSVLGDEVINCANWKQLEIAIHLFIKTPVEKLTEYVRCENVRGEAIAKVHTKCIDGTAD